jgi:FMN phosphatase YigB (HAD superfamily)
MEDVHPSEVLFWDDSPNNVAVAQAAELHAEHYTDFPAFIQTMKTYELIK